LLFPHSRRRTLLRTQVQARVARWHIFRPNIPILGKFWRVLQWKMLVYLIAIWSYLRPFGIFCGHLVCLHTYFMVIWNIFPCFGTFYQEKSGNPGSSPWSSQFRVILNIANAITTCQHCVCPFWPRVLCR
jgi:hypothetical protein